VEGKYRWRPCYIRKDASPTQLLKNKACGRKRKNKNITPKRNRNGEGGISPCLEEQTFVVNLEKGWEVHMIIFLAFIQRNFFLKLNDLDEVIFKANKIRKFVCLIYFYLFFLNGKCIFFGDKNMEIIKILKLSTSVIKIFVFSFKQYKKRKLSNFIIKSKISNK